VPAVRKKGFRAFAGMLVAAALVATPLVTAGASAAGPVIKGEIGELQPWTPETNRASYWESQYAEHDAVCHKFDDDDSNRYGIVSDDEKTITLRPYKSSWPGDHWELLVVKGGSEWNNVIAHPQAGVAYASPPNSAGKQADVSHWIICFGTTPVTPPTIVIPTLTFTPATCETPGVLTRSEDVEWTSLANEDGSTTWTASPKPGTVFPVEARTSWTVPNLDQLPLDSDACRPDQPPADVVVTPVSTPSCDTKTVTIETTTVTTPFVWNGATWELGTPTVTVQTSSREMTVDERLACPLPPAVVVEGAWIDGTWQCGDTTVVETREVTTTPYVYDEQGDAVPGEPVVVTETNTRNLTSEEIGGECDLVPGPITATCVSDVPYLNYELALPAGFEADGDTPLTIRFVNPEGADYVTSGRPLTGTLLWPGATAGTPKMWPGWEFIGGEYIDTGGNFGWARGSVMVRFDVNPSYSAVVTYPAECAPPGGGGASGADAEVLLPGGGLANTGGGVSPLLAVGGVSALLAGLAVTIVAVRRRADA